MTEMSSISDDSDNQFNDIFASDESEMQERVQPRQNGVMKPPQRSNTLTQKLTTHHPQYDSPSMNADAQIDSANESGQFNSAIDEEAGEQEDDICSDDGSVSSDDNQEEEDGDDDGDDEDYFNYAQSDFEDLEKEEEEEESYNGYSYSKASSTKNNRSQKSSSAKYGKYQRSGKMQAKSAKVGEVFGKKKQKKTKDDDQISGNSKVGLILNAKNSRNYSELVSVIPLLRNFDWFESTTGLHSKILPIKFFTASSFWFIVCAEYFPRRFVYNNEIDLLRELRANIEKQFVIEIVNRTARFNQKNSQYLNSGQQQQLHQQLTCAEDESGLQLLSIATGNTSNEDTNGMKPLVELKLLDNSHQQNDSVTIPCGESNKQPMDESLMKEESEKVTQSAEEEEEAVAAAAGSSSTDGLTKTAAIRQLIRDQEQRIRSLKSVRVDVANKYAYTFEDDVYMIQQRIFLLELLEQKGITSESEKQEDRLAGLMSIELDALIDLVCFEHKQIEDEVNDMFAVLENRMHIDFKQEVRVNQAASIDFKDALVDLHTMNPMEIEFIRYLEARQQNLLSGTAVKIEDQTLNNNQQDRAASKKSNAAMVSEDKKKTDDTKCNVCNEGDYTDYDLIVFCARCNVSVHQRCYGIPYLPSGDWVCDTCLVFGPNGRYLPCAMCSRRGGALKQATINIGTNIFESINPEYHMYLQECVANSSSIPDAFDYSTWERDRSSRTFEANEDNGDNFLYDFQVECQDLYLKGSEAKYHEIEKEERIKQPMAKCVWVHLTCALWTPECFFEDRATMSRVKGVDSINKRRYQLPCVICKKSLKGSCITCEKPKCTDSFHPECARRAGLCLEVKNVETMAHVGYCQRHTPLKLHRVLEFKVKKNKEEITKFCRSVAKYNETYFNEAFRHKPKEKGPKVTKLDKEKARKDQEKMNKDFIRCLCNRQLEIQCEIDQQSKQQNLHKIKINQLRQCTFKPHILKQDLIWSTLDFNNYREHELFMLYKKLIKPKKAEFKSEFLKLKKSLERDIIQESKKSKKMEKEIALKQSTKSSKKPPHFKINGPRKASMYGASYPGAQHAKKQKKLKLNNLDDDDNDFMDSYDDDDIFEDGDIDGNNSSDFPLHEEKKSKTKKKTKQAKNVNVYSYVQEDDGIIEEENPDAVYCYCQKHYNFGQIMMQCAQCSEWFHFECVGYTGNEQQASNLDFCCQECNPASKHSLHGDSRLFNPDFALFETYFKKKSPQKQALKEQQQSQQQEGQLQQNRDEIADEELEDKELDVQYESITDGYMSWFKSHNVVAETVFAIKRDNYGNHFSLVIPNKQSATKSS